MYIDKLVQAAKTSAQTGCDITNRSRRRPPPLALLCLLALLTNARASAAPASDSRAPLMLSIDELFLCSSEGPLADDRHRSTVPLAPRLTPRALPGKSRRPQGPRVLIVPDGIDSLDRQVRAENRFNHYLFTQWAYVDVLNWFGGTADANINIPARAWVEAAHQNGVKVIGTVFFAPKAWGGQPEQALRLIERDPDGTFPAARQLVRIASHYGFDGWLINQETDLDTAGAKVGDTFAEGAADIPLFATAIEATGRIAVSVAYLNNSGYDGATIYPATADGERRMLPLPAGGSGWQERTDVFVIESANPIITIGVGLPASDRETATLLLGRLSVSTASVEPDSC